MSSFEEIAGPVHVSPLDEQSFEMHELFSSLVSAGFRERQALMLVAYILSETQQDYYVSVEEMNEHESDDDEEEEES
jgi:hypothetical protein